MTVLEPGVKYKILHRAFGGGNKRRVSVLLFLETIDGKRVFSGRPVVGNVTVDPMMIERISPVADSTEIVVNRHPEPGEFV